MGRIRASHAVRDDRGEAGDQPAVFGLAQLETRIADVVRAIELLAQEPIGLEFADQHHDDALGLLGLGPNR
jgi:hypothetical protein